jgi:DNA-binding CsgD family transcriptional regulator/tetratricopeptide (TPR) repeat protein
MDDLFVGRVRELALLNGWLASAADGNGQVVLVAGAPGIGKTALIRRFLAGGRAYALRGSGDPDEMRLSGGLLEQLARSVSGPPARSLLELLDAGPPDLLSAGSALLGMIAELSAEQPVVMVVDDAHWGDELSLKALTFAVRRLLSQPVLCLILTSPGEMDRLPAGLVRVVGDRGSRLDLGGICPEDVALLAELSGAGRLSLRAAQRLYQHTGGTPLHVRELLHDLPRHALHDPTAVLPAPRSVETLVLSRLATCALETERLVVAAAVLGNECRLGDAAALARLDDPLPALQEAVQQRLLTERDTAGGRCCAFAHTMLRSAVYRDIGVDRRAALHLAAARLSTGTAALAHRVAAARRTDPALAAELDAEAEAEVAAGRGAEAAGHFLAALRVGEPGARHGQRLLAAVGLLINLGDAARAQGYLDELISLPPSGARSLVLGRLAIVTGDHVAAERWLGEAWEILVAPASLATDAVAAAACEMALVLLSDHRTEAAARWAQRAVRAAATGFTRACSHAVLGACQALAGRADQARALLESELARCPDTRSELMVRVGLGSVLLWTDDLDGAAAQLGTVAWREDAPGLPLPDLLVATLHSVIIDYRRGEWGAATAGAEKLVSLVDDLDQGWLLCGAHAAAVHPHAGRGQWQQAAAHAEAAARHARTQSASELVALVNARAALAFAADDPGGVVAAVQPISGRLDELALVEPTLLGFWPSYAWALVRLGQHDDAEHVLRPFEEIAQARGRRSALAAAARVRGCLASARHLPAAARMSFADSIDNLAGLGMPYEEALTRLDHGRFLRRIGQRRAAVREVSKARSIFAALGARPFLTRCDAELGIDTGSWNPAVPPPLTGRQRTVAQAVAAGKSNREIAHDLYISIKTVEFHISQILARLGVDSRTEIAGVLAQTAAQSSPRGSNDARAGK